jgi:hypothetical protein
MIKRRNDEVAEGPAASTYLAMAVAAPGGRFGERPMVTGAAEIAPALPGPGWCTKVVGDELPTGYSIEDLPALGGAGNEPLHSTGIADAIEGVSADRESGHGRQR